MWERVYDDDKELGGHRAAARLTPSGPAPKKGNARVLCSMSATFFLGFHRLQTEGGSTTQFEGRLPYHAWGSRYLKLESPNQVGTDVKVFQTLFWARHGRRPWTDYLGQLRTIRASLWRSAFW